MTLTEACPKYGAHHIIIGPAYPKYGAPPALAPDHYCARGLGSRQSAESVPWIAAATFAELAGQVLKQEQAEWQAAGSRPSRTLPPLILGPDPLHVLQEAAEQFLLEMFGDCGKLAELRNTQTVGVRKVRAWRKLVFGAEEAQPHGYTG